jgi:hypothetical protein
MALRLFGDGRIEPIVEITADSPTDVPLTLIGAEDQTANLLEIKDDAGDVVAEIGPDGDLLSKDVSATNATFTGNASVTGNLTVDTNTLVVDSVNNRVGIGIPSPTSPLEVNGRVTTTSSGEWNFLTRSTNSTSSSRNHFLSQRANGSSAVTSGFTLGGLSVGGFDGTNYSFGWNGGAEITAVASQNWTSSNRGTNLLFLTTPDNSTNITERMRISSDGNIAINTSPVTSDMLRIFDNSTNGHSLMGQANNASYSNVIFDARAVRTANAGYWFFAGRSDVNGVFDNEVLLRGDGNNFCDGAWNGGGADYAEYFEWLDNNPEKEDRRGISVTLENDKIKPAEEGEKLIGVISGNPAVVGDSAFNKWHKKYLRDDFGSYIMEDYDVLQWTDEEGNEKAVDADGPDASDAPENATVVVQQRRKLNPVYDPDVEYISREDRPEWAVVGLMGKLRIRKGQPTDPRWIKMRDVSDEVEEWLVR